MVSASADSLASPLPLLATKLFVPTPRTGAISRSRLVERLDQGLQGRLSLVSAPPGFGKTSLLADWLTRVADRGIGVAWLSLDEGDNDLATFWTYAISALQKLEPGIGTEALSLLQTSPLPPIQAILGPVLNHLSTRTTAALLVLDDFHTLGSTGIHESVAYFLDRMPPTLHLVIASRSDPLLPLSRLRVRGELTEVRASDLRFTPEEAASFLNRVMGLHLSSQQVSALESRTEGWIAALQLAGLSMRGRDDASSFIDAFTGNDRYIVDYLVDEVLERQPTAIRDFLVQTSILDRFNASLCEAVTRQGNGRATLDDLERLNLFLVPLDTTRTWYRYHHLFADVLGSHLSDLGAGEAQALHQRAGAWFERNGERPQATRHFLAAQDYLEAARLIALDAEATVRSHRTDRFIESLRPIPDAVVRDQPLLSAYYGHALQGVGDMEGSTARLDDAERGLRLAESSTPPADPETLRVLRSRIVVGRGYLAMAAGNLESTIEYAREVLAFLAPGEHHWHGTAAGLLSMALWARGDLEEAQVQHAIGLDCFERAGDTGIAATSAYHDADLLKGRGLLRAAEARYRRSLEFAERAGVAAMRMAPNLLIGLAELQCEWNDLDAAAASLGRAQELGIYPPRTPFRHLLARARLQQSLGEPAAALRLLEEAERIQVRGAVPDFRPVAAWKARLRLALGDLDGVAGWIAAHGLSVDGPADYLKEYEHLTLARFLLGRFRRERDPQDIADLERLLDRLAVAADAGGRGAALIEIALLRAVAKFETSDTAAAMDALAVALQRAEPERYCRIFLDEGAPMTELLAYAVRAGAGGAYGRRLLAASELAQADSSRRTVSIPGLPEALTPRELEIVALVAAGMQNQDIADHLVISLATVKRHIANAYGKLGVSHRTAAVARATELGLL